MSEISAKPLVRRQDDAGVRMLILDRGDGQNAVGPDLTANLAHELHAAASDESVRVLVLTGAGRMFSAGGSLDLLSERVASRDPESERAGLAKALELIAAIVNFPRPTIAMVNGAAAGGGLALALACDLRIASDRAKLAYAYSTIGLAGDFGINWLLARLIGPGRARSVAFGGPLAAQDAFRLGLVDDVVDHDGLSDRAMAHARALAEMSPPALAAIKRNLDAAALGFAEAGALEAESFLTLRGSPEHRAALEKLMATFAARRA